MIAQTIYQKRGDTFSYGGVITGLIGPVTARAMLRNPAQGNGLVDSLTVTLGSFVDANTPVSILIEEVASVTAAWPVGALTCDIELTDMAGVVVSSPTFTVKVVADVTYP